MLPEDVAVVICLKNRTFAVSQTTLVQMGHRTEALWFAWKIVLLQYRKQPNGKGKWAVFCCDLLEKSYFCSIANNRSVTTSSRRKLWFAWKIVLLQYRKQQQFHRLFRISVVICLKNRTFAVSQTTEWICFRIPIALWFAWKIVLLQYRKQPIFPTLSFASCCDLLEKSYFCSIANNRSSISPNERRVVICLKNRTFAVSQTTVHDRCTHSSTLWFAWKIVLLQYRKQRSSSTGARQGRCDLLEKSYFCSIANN